VLLGELQGVEAWPVLAAHPYPAAAYQEAAAAAHPPHPGARRAAAAQAAVPGAGLLLVALPVHHLHHSHQLGDKNAAALQNAASLLLG